MLDTTLLYTIEYKGTLYVVEHVPAPLREVALPCIEPPVAAAASEPLRAWPTDGLLRWRVRRCSTGPAPGPDPGADRPRGPRYRCAAAASAGCCLTAVRSTARTRRTGLRAVQRDAPDGTGNGVTLVADGRAQSAAWHLRPRRTGTVMLAPVDAAWGAV